jgi:hypothetical protein
MAGTSADLIHEIGPLVGKSRFGRAKVHATRALSRARGFLSQDLPHAKETFDKMAPYLPSLGRLIYVELKEKIPAPREAWTSLMRRAVPKSEESAEVEIPTDHEYISAPEPRAEHGPETVRLQVVG